MIKVFQDSIMRHFFSIIFLAGFFAKAASDSANLKNEARLKEFAKENYPVEINIGPISKAPNPDGKISVSEWDNCAAFTGFRDFDSQQLINSGLLIKAAYDEQDFHCLIIVPKPRPVLPKRPVDDMELYRDNGVVELMLAPESPTDAPIRRLAVSASGSYVDMHGTDLTWDSQARIALGDSKDAASIPWLSKAQLPEQWWFVELSIPLKALGLIGTAGSTWRCNFFWLDNGNYSFAPVRKSAIELAYFADLKLKDADTPLLALYSLGNPTARYFDLQGELLNYSKKTLVESDLFACKIGTHFRTQTGYDEIVGELETYIDKAESSLPPIKRWLTRPTSDLTDLQIKADGQTIFRLAAPVKVASPLELQIENYPSKKEAQLIVKCTNNEPLQLNIYSQGGKKILQKQINTGRIPINYADWEEADYTLELSQGELIVKQVLQNTRPEWLDANIGASDLVLKPFEALRIESDEISMWNRTYRWTDSALFDYRNGEKSWRNAPVLIIQRSGQSLPIRLTEKRLISSSPTIVEFYLRGEAAGFTLEGNAKLEYDGLVWFDFNIKSTDEQNANIDGMVLSCHFDKKNVTHYHGAPDRSLNGAIPQTKQNFPWQVYFWVGAPEGGLGFINESQQMYNNVPSSETFSLEQKDDELIWQINLAGPGKIIEQKLSFGLQVTPVKKLPDNYENMLTENWGRHRRDNFSKLSSFMDFTTIMRSNCKYMPLICDPAGIDYPILKAAVDDAHRDKVMAIPYFAPISFTENAQPEHLRFYNEWVQLPIRRWKAVESVQVRCCVNSSYLDYILYNLSLVEKNTGADGFYFDGAWPVACNNTAHGCGYYDAEGRLHPTYSVRKMREFLRRSATLLAERMQARPNRSELRNWGEAFPDYHLWIHISGSVAPPIHSFSTALFCGEWFKAAIRSGQGYDTLLTLDKFYPRYLSQPWGIVNFFLPIVNPKLDAAFHTNATLAYLVPAGVALYPRYLQLEMVQQILQIKKEFGVSSADFFPPWQKPDLLEIKSGKNIQVGTWIKNDQALLLAIGNCGSTPEKIVIQTKKTGKATIRFGQNNIKQSGSTIHMELLSNTLTMLEINQLGIRE